MLCHPMWHYPNVWHKAQIKSSALLPPISQSIHYDVCIFMLHSGGNTFMAIMVNRLFSEFLRIFTLMASRNLAVCQNKSQAWKSLGPVCPGGRMFMRINPHHNSTAQWWRWKRDERGSLSIRNHSDPQSGGIYFLASNYKDQGPPMGCARGCSLDVCVWGVTSFHLVDPLDIFLKAHPWTCILL